MTDTAIETGRRVMRIEAEALARFAETLDESFARAVDAILAIEGRVILSGMGKSGHVARKIAATFASTGTPAQFVHPAEASHGDLGMLTRRDLALVLSNSGETPELRDIIAHCGRFGIPLIGVASRPESGLMRAADIALALPQAPEACPVGMAPTTSTTLTLALGDALAVALMERRRFTAERFRDFHPGGKLGAMLVKVADLMHARLPLVNAEADMRAAIAAMSSGGFGLVGLTDAGGRLAGVVTDGDLRRHIVGLLDRSPADIASKSPRSIAADALASEAMAAMNAAPPVTALFVLDDDRRPVGLIHIHDCLRAGLS